MGCYEEMHKLVSTSVGHYTYRGVEACQEIVGTPAWLEDPCCNLRASLNTCCKPQDVVYAYTVEDSFHEALLSDKCQQGVCALYTLSPLLPPLLSFTILGLLDSPSFFSSPSFNLTPIYLGARSHNTLNVRDSYMSPPRAVGLPGRRIRVASTSKPPSLQ